MMSGTSVRSKNDWMRNCSDDDIINGYYDYSYIEQAFHADFYHDVYYSYIMYNTYYIDDLRAMKKFETLNPSLYSGLYDNVTLSVLRLCIQHCNHTHVVEQVLKLK